MSATVAPSPVAAKPAFRNDIQGLRAIAVLAVIADHLFGWPFGGFVGVDVFFVISGFVITGMLLREHERSGRISFADFYRRRVRRITPIATLVLVLTVGIGYLLYLSSRAQGIAIDALFAFVFSANWHFAAAGTDYWANDGFVSPVQHFWSLAVEEQFYAIWPLILVGVFAIAAARGLSRRGSRVTLGIVLVVISAASFAWAMWETSNAPMWAYFSTFSRAWELGIGALIAIVAPALARLPHALRPVLAWLGIGGIVASLLIITEDMLFPAPWAALPVLATALVIAAGTGGEQKLLFPLTNPVARYLGDISYSLYLWHFPIVVMLLVVMPEGPLYYAIGLGATLLLSALSYRFIEDPIRRSSWLEPRFHARRRNRGQRQSPISAVLVSGLVVVALVLVGMVFVRQNTFSAALAAPEPAPTLITVDGDTPAMALAAEISTALGATEFPQLSPAVDQLGTEAWIDQVADGGCADIDEDNAQSCATGPDDARLDVAVLGDSYAIAWMPAVRAALEPLGWKVHPFTRGQCPSASVGVTRDGGAPFPECEPHREWALGAIGDLAPDLVILADADNSLERLASGATGQAGADEFAAGVEATVAALQTETTRVAILTPPPAGPSLLSCVTRVSAPSACESTVGTRWTLFRDALEAGAGERAQFTDTETWFCSARGVCPGFVGTTPVRADGAHITVEYSTLLGPVLQAALIPDEDEA